MTLDEKRALLSGDGRFVPEPGAVLDKLNADPVHRLTLRRCHVITQSGRGSDFSHVGREGDVMLGGGGRGLSPGRPDAFAGGGRLGGGRVPFLR